MRLHHHGGPRAPGSGPRGPIARATPATAREIARVIAHRITLQIIWPLAALCVIAGTTVSCGSASTPLEKYQNCLRCGYSFNEPMPTAQAVLRRSGS
jgi:hypothetical protein